MKKKNSTTKIALIVLCIVLVSSYLIYHAVLASKSEMETQLALQETVYKTIDTQGFFVRDEKFITDNTAGTTVSFAKNGERVAAGDTVSMVFASSVDASSYLKLSELEKEIEHYEELSGQANFQSVNINSLNGKIDSELVSFLESVNNRDYEKAVTSAEIFRDSVTGKQIAIGENLDFSQKLNNLKNQLSEIQKNNYAYTEIKSDSSGYYINGSDGYENTIDFAKINELSVDEISKAVSSKPGSISNDVVGRIVGSFQWYIVCVVPTDKTVGLTQNDSLYINVHSEGVERLPVKLYKIGERDKEKILLIFECDVMNEDLADLRIEDIEIITHEYKGYKISNEAIRTVNGVKGVYIVRGNIVGFRKIHIVYSTSTFTIVNNPDGEENYIKQYDKVVTKGVELYDNKLL